MSDVETRPTLQATIERHKTLQIEDIPLLQYLPKDQLHALVLVAVRKLTYDETAIELSPGRQFEHAPQLGTIKSRVSRARDKLRLLIANRDEYLPLEHSQLKPWHRDQVLLRPDPGRELEHGLAFLEQVSSNDAYKKYFEDGISRALVRSSSKRRA